MRVGAFALTGPGDTLAIEGETTAGIASTGRARHYELVGPDGVHLTVRDACWSNGERDITTCERHESPQRFDTLVGRLRLSVLGHASGHYVELQQARLRGTRAQTFRADLRELDAAAGVSCIDALITGGATAVGPREQVLQESGRRRAYLVAMFADDDSLVPVVAYVLTRVAPVAAGVTA